MEHVWKTGATGSHSLPRANLPLTFNTGCWWIRLYMKCLHSISITFSFPPCICFTVAWYPADSWLVLWSSLHLSPDPFDHRCLFPPIQHAHETSRPVWLQAAESAYRFSLGSIAGGEWHVCGGGPQPARGVTLAGLTAATEALGPTIVFLGRGTVMWGSGIVLPCHRWLQAVFGDGALEWHKSSGTALPGISLSNYTGGTRNKEPLT